MESVFNNLKNDIARNRKEISQLPLEYFVGKYFYEEGEDGDEYFFVHRINETRNLLGISIFKGNCYFIVSNNEHIYPNLLAKEITKEDFNKRLNDAIQFTQNLLQ